MKLQRLFIYGIWLVATGCAFSVHGAQGGVKQPISLVAHPEKLPEVLNEISSLLHDAVNAANIAVKKEEDKEKTADAEARRIEVRDKHRDICFANINQVQLLLDELIKYFDLSDPDKIAQLATSALSPSMLEYIEYISEHGFNQLKADLDAWCKPIRERGSTISAADIDKIVDQRPSLLGCALFWDEFLYVSPPCIGDIQHLITSLCPMHKYCDLRFDKQKTLPQQAAKPLEEQLRNVATSTGNNVVKSAATYGADMLKPISDTVSSIKATPSYGKKYKRDIGAFLQQCIPVQQKIHRLEKYIPPICHDSLFYDGQRMKNYIAAKDEFDNMVIGIQQIHQKSPGELRKLFTTMPLVTILARYKEMANQLRKCDGLLRKTTPGLLSMPHLTQEQRDSLQDFRNRETLFSQDASTLHNIITESVNCLKSILPRVDTASLCLQKLQESFEIFERDRGRGSYDPPPHQGSQHRPTGTFEWILKGLGLSATADSIHWLANQGFPIAIDYIAKSAGTIHEGTVNFETARTALAIQLHKIHLCAGWHTPLKSLDQICTRGSTMHTSLIAGNCLERYRQHNVQNNTYEELEKQIDATANQLSQELKRVKEVEELLLADAYPDRNNLNLCRGLIKLINCVGSSDRFEYLQQNFRSWQEPPTIHYQRFMQPGGNALMITMDAFSGATSWIPKQEEYSTARVNSLLSEYIALQTQTQALQAQRSAEQWLSRTKMESPLLEPIQRMPQQSQFIRKFTAPKIHTLWQEFVSVPWLNNPHNKSISQKVFNIWNTSWHTVQRTYGLDEDTAAKIAIPTLEYRLVKQEQEAAEQEYQRHWQAYEQQKRDFRNKTWLKRCALNILAWVGIRPVIPEIYETNLSAAGVKVAPLAHRLMVLQSGTYEAWLKQHNLNPSPLETNALVSEMFAIYNASANVANG